MFSYLSTGNRSYWSWPMCFLFGSILALLLCSETMNAQVQIYPVSVTTRLTPPYSVNLADYAAPGSEQLKVIILQRDLTQAPYMLYLRMEIELNGRVIIRTSPEYNPPALTLDPGIPTVISGTDLSVFFDPSHLEFTAYSRDTYMRTKTLPEGSYTITFTAYDHVRRDVALSHGGSMFCYLAKTDPPMLNLPLNNALVRCQDPQHINFQWLSRSVSSPNSAFSTAYRFELFEMRTGGNPGDVVQTTRPVYTCETDQTTFQYTISETPLVKGMRYAWRVKAFDRFGRDYIRNDGNSEVFSFLYDDIMSEAETINFNEIQNFSAKAIGPRKALLKWDASPEYSSYKISYRENEKGKWFEDETDKDSLEVAGLTPGTVYDCRVQGRRGRAWGNYSENDTVRTPMLPVIECGNPFQPLSVSNRQPLPELRRMQQFDAGGFMVTVMDPYAASFSPGRFTGNGFVRVPLFGHKKLSCEFNDVFINTDYQMVEGSVRLLYNANNNLLTNLDDEFEGGGDNGKVKEGIEQVDIILPDIKISDVKEIIPDIGDREILIVKDGDTTRIDITSQLETNAKAVTIKDEAGNIYSVDAGTGKVTAMGKALPGGSMSLSIPSTIDSKMGIVTFERAEKSNYAFDKWDDNYKQANIFREEYQIIKTSDNDDYYVPVKLIPPGETDIVGAFVEKGKADSLKFVSGTGTVYTPSRDGSKYLLTLPAAKEDDAYEIFAMAKDAQNNQVLLGKLLVVTYPVKSPKLVLVPVNGIGKDVDVSMIKEELDKIYNPVSVDWQVEKDTVFNPVDNTMGNTLDVTGSGLFSQYTESMKALNSAFIEAKGDGFDESAIYLFMLNSAQSTSDGTRKLTGDMPRSKQFGYLFMKTLDEHQDAIVRTIAHEISHGAFHLNHTFDNQYRIPEGNTNNLMDYSSGTTLVKHQWDAIHDPGLVIGMFERDEEGANIFRSYDNEVIKKINAIKKAYAEGTTISGKIPAKIEDKLLTGTNIKLGNEKYEKLMVFNYGLSNKEFNINPKEYKLFRYIETPNEVDPAKNMEVGGFEFYDQKSLVLRILVQATTNKINSKIDSLKNYLFKLDSHLYYETKSIQQNLDLATKVASKFTNGSACNLCVRSALYLINKDSSLFPVTGSRFNDPYNNYMPREIKGYITHDGNAFKVVSDFNNIVKKSKLNESFVEIVKGQNETWLDYFKKIQDEADKGIIIIGVMLNSDGTRGHVMMIAPGGLVKINKDEQNWGYTYYNSGITEMPRVLECGGNDRLSEAPLCRNVDRNGSQKRLKWFKYTK